MDIETWYLEITKWADGMNHNEDVRGRYSSSSTTCRKA